MKIEYYSKKKFKLNSNKNLNKIQSKLNSYKKITPKLNHNQSQKINHNVQSIIIR